MCRVGAVMIFTVRNFLMRLCLRLTNFISEIFPIYLSFNRDAHSTALGTYTNTPIVFLFFPFVSKVTTVDLPSHNTLLRLNNLLNDNFEQERLGENENGVREEGFYREE